jgi:hypothetical protein
MLARIHQYCFAGQPVSACIVVWAGIGGFGAFVVLATGVHLNHVSATISVSGTPGRPRSLRHVLFGQSSSRCGRFKRVPTR